jgi:hypothetical protein
LADGLRNGFTLPFEPFRVARVAWTQGDYATVHGHRLRFGEETPEHLRLDASVGDDRGPDRADVFERWLEFLTGRPVGLTA